MTLLKKREFIEKYNKKIPQIISTQFIIKEKLEKTELIENLIVKLVM